MSKLKILHVVGSLGIGGVENFVMDVVRSGNHERFSFDICEMASLPGQQVVEAKEYGAKVFQCPFAGNILNYGKEFANYIKEGEYDCVHAHRYDVSAIPLRIAGKVGINKRIAHYHNVKLFDVKNLKHWAYPLLKAGTKKYATKIISCSKNVQDTQFGDIDGDSRYSIINYGIRVDKFKYNKDSRERIRKEFNIADDQVVVGNCSRVVEQKGSIFFTKIAIELLKQYKKLIFMLVGDGDQFSEVKRIITAANVQNNFIMPGTRTDIGEILSSLDIFFFPSNWEGFGISLIEAQVAGLPCVTSILPCFEEALAPELQEKSFEKGDEKKALESLKAFIDSKPERQKYSKIAADFGDGFSVANMIQKVQNVYLS